MGKTKAKDPKDRPLTDKQKAFVAMYTDPDADTFLNATATAKKLVRNPDSPAVGEYGYRWRHKPQVENAIQERLEANGFGMESRLQALAQIGNGVAKTEKEIVTKSGEVVTIEVRPSIRERLQAIDLANKVDGTYSQQKIDVQTAIDESADLRKRILRDVTNT